MMANETHNVEPSREIFLDVRDLSRRFVRRRALSQAKFTVEALSGVNLKVRWGATLAIVGESGAGKSTLGRCLALLEKPSSGEILLGGRNVLALGRRELLSIHRQIQLIFQDPISALNPRLTASEIIAEPLAVQCVGKRIDQQRRALELLERVGLPARAARKRPFEFSGGECQRIAIARALALEPRLLILDEALSNLDLANQRLILALLSELKASCSLTLIHISHDLRLVSDLADEVAVMCAGRIVEHKPTKALFSDPQREYTQRLLAARRPLESIVEERFSQELT